MAEPSSDEGEEEAEPPQPEPTEAAAVAAADGAAQADALPEDAVDCSVAASVAAQGGEEAQQEQQKEQQQPQRRFGVLSSRKLSTQLDMREDSMETVLSYLEVRITEAVDDALCACYSSSSSCQLQLLSCLAQAAQAAAALTGRWPGC